MIPNTNPTARLLREVGGTPLAVVGWAPGGDPLVIGPNGLFTPDEWEEVYDEPQAYRQVVPAPGWFAQFDGDNPFRLPLVGWGVRFDGEVEPLVVDGERHVAPAHDTGYTAKFVAVLHESEVSP